MPWLVSSEESCRPGGIRTPNRRFWRPLLYHWSYWPRTALASDLPFLVVGVLPAPGAELAQLELVLALPPVLGRRVIPALTHRTLQRDDAPVSLRHDSSSRVNGKEGKATWNGSSPLQGAVHPGARGRQSYSYSSTSATTPAPTVRPPTRMANRSSFSMAMGVMSSTSIAMLSPGITISTLSGSFTVPVTSVVRK